MKRLIPIALAALIASMPCGCGKGAEEPGAGEPQEPVVTVEQQIKTPTLKKREQISPPPALPPELAAQPVEPKKPAPPKEIVPGMPLETPPLPPESTEEEEEAALQPEEVTPQPATPAPQIPALPGLPGLPPPKPAPSLTAEEIAFKPKLVAGATNVDIVLDASGSMNASLGSNGSTKFDLVRRAVEDILLEASQQQDVPRNIGIRVFGATKPIADDDCNDTQALLPLGPVNIGELTTALATVEPQGKSLVSRALAAAAADFPADVTGDKVILLIADGSDACAEDPCVTAQRIHDKRTLVQVIGFDVSADDQVELRCVADKSGGSFYLARTEAELRRAIDEALSAHAPYNLRLTVVAGAAPIPTDITVMKAGTSKVVSKERSFGSKIFKLPSGSYDILIEYADSPEKRKPSKLLKDVEILANTKLEQTVTFDVGYLSLSSINEEGKVVPASYRILSAGTSRAVAEVETGPEKKTITMNAGTYDIMAQQVGPGAEELVLMEKAVKVETGKAASAVFRFQRGSLVVRGETTQNKKIPFIFQIFTAGRADALIASGAVPEDGSTIALSPGRYDMIATGQDPDLPADPRTKVSNITIQAGSSANLTVMFEMGELNLSAVDDQGKPLSAEFVIKDEATAMEIARVSSKDAQPVMIPIPPGKYDVTAYSTRTTVDPKPHVTIKGVEVTPKEPVSKQAKFVLGSLRTRGINAKEEPVRTQFTLYAAGGDDIIATSKPTADWVIFEVPPGDYDMVAVDTAATTPEKPEITLNDLRVKAGQTISHQAIFTAGQISIIGRGPNNKIIAVAFKIFEYGADRELISGKTGDDWAKYEIPPGRYYMEAAYVDPVQDVTLKKWVNISVGKNEMVEQVLRF